jgi:hypothetical protein
MAPPTLAKAEFTTIRERPIKIGARVIERIARRTPIEHIRSIRLQSKA